MEKIQIGSNEYIVREKDKFFVFGTHYGTGAKYLDELHFNEEGNAEYQQGHGARVTYNKKKLNMLFDLETL